MRVEIASLCLLGLPCLLACETRGTALPEPSAKSAAAAAPAPSATAVASAAPAPSAGAAPAPSANAAPAPSASATAEGPCPPDARRFSEPKFCVVFPKKPLDVTYEGDEKQGTTELELSGRALRFFWGPVAKPSKESVKAQLEKVETGAELVASGEIPGGAWSDVKTADGKHTVQSALKKSKLFIQCVATVEEARVQEMRGVCMSMRAY